MSNYDIQKSVVESINTIVDMRLKSMSKTDSQIGVVQSDPAGFTCKVTIGEHTYTCQLPEHLHTWIQKDDIVVVQDLYGDGAKKVVTGKVGAKSETPSLVFYDEEEEKNISGVDGIFDEEGNKRDEYGTV